MLWFNDSIEKAYLENRLDQKNQCYSSYSLLIIDEVGYLPLDKNTSNYFFLLIAKKMKKRKLSLQRVNLLMSGEKFLVITY